MYHTTMFDLSKGDVTQSKIQETNHVVSDLLGINTFFFSFSLFSQIYFFLQFSFLTFLSFTLEIIFFPLNT